MPSDKPKSKEVPQEILSLLSAADKRQGFPAGTMSSLMQQEVGGNFNKYLTDPTAYHYQAGADGKRIAPQSGKVSTAFGPFGLLESTAADPGYGVKPLAGKDLSEQIRFASDYLAARSKSAGGLPAGLAGYGEGAKYSQQVMARVKPSAAVSPLAQPDSVIAASSLPMPVQVPVQQAPVMLAQAEPMPMPVGLPPEAPAVPMTTAALAPDAWQTFLKGMPQQPGEPPVRVEDLNFGNAVASLQIPNFQAAVPQSMRPNFSAFGQWGANARGRTA